MQLSSLIQVENRYKFIYGEWTSLYIYKDTGIGIPKIRQVIFENFEQLDTTLSRGCEGTGMDCL